MADTPGASGWLNAKWRGIPHWALIGGAGALVVGLYILKKRAAAGSSSSTAGGAAAPLSSGSSDFGGGGGGLSGGGTPLAPTLTGSGVPGGGLQSAVSGGATSTASGALEQVSPGTNVFLPGTNPAAPTPGSYVGTVGQQGFIFTPDANGNYGPNPATGIAPPPGANPVTGGVPAGANPNVPYASVSH